MEGERVGRVVVVIGGGFGGETEESTGEAEAYGCESTEKEFSNNVGRVYDFRGWRLGWLLRLNWLRLRW